MEKQIVYRLVPSRNHWTDAACLAVFGLSLGFLLGVTLGFVG